MSVLFPDICTICKGNIFEALELNHIVCFNQILERGGKALANAVLKRSTTINGICIDQYTTEITILQDAINTYKTGYIHLLMRHGADISKVHLPSVKQSSRTVSFNDYKILLETLVSYNIGATQKIEYYRDALLEYNIDPETIINNLAPLLVNANYHIGNDEYQCIQYHFGFDGRHYLESIVAIEEAKIPPLIKDALD
jgi:hypothetical protein